jgi:hypothetical protein
MTTLTENTESRHEQNAAATVDAERAARIVEALMAIKWPEDQKPPLHQMLVEALEIVTFKAVEYRGFTIQPICHAFQPFWIEGRWHTRGFIAVRDGCHALPGAVWFHSVEEAKNGIACFIEAKADAKRFWQLLRKES